MELVLVIAFCSVALLIVLYLIGAYNDLTRLRNEVREAAGTLAAQLQQRHDLVPDMANAARESAEIQREYLKEVLTTRGRLFGITNSGEQGEGEASGGDRSERTGPVGYAESSPQMSVETYSQAQKVQAATEEDIAAARRFLQAAIAQYNSAVESFPSSIVASVGGFQPYNFLQVSEEIAAKPEVWMRPRPR